MAFFIVKFGSPSVPSGDWMTATNSEGLELRWTEGGAAAAYAKELNEGYRERGEELRAAVKRETDPATDIDWRARARERFASGHWAVTPWHDAFWTYASGNASSPDKDHFVHVAKGDATKVAFYASETDGVSDRLTVITPGRYLERFYGQHSSYPMLSPAAIGNYAAEMGADADDTELHFAETEDEFEHVYTNGPSSCMAYDADEYSSPCHPVRVYAAGDLQLAYLTRDDHIIARALVFPAKHQYSRIYGDDIRLSRKLHALGYARGNLMGARMRRIECDGYFVAPYLDCVGRAHDNGEYLIISGDGEILCQNTNGLCEMPTTCPHCGEHCDRDEMVYIGGETRESWCADCAGNDAFYCQDCGTYYANDDRDHFDVVRRRRFSWRANPLVEHHVTVCSECVSDYTFIPNRGEFYSNDYVFQCAACHEHFVTDDEHATHPDHCSACGAAIDNPHDAPSSYDPHPDQTELTLSA